MTASTKPKPLTIDTAAVLNAALELGDMGIRVFPCMPDKPPAISQWRRNASGEEEQIHRWFDAGGRLIGMPTGLTYDILDVDPRKPGALEWWEANKHRIPVTRRHETLQGGWHLLFMAKPGMRDSVSKIAPGIDVKSYGGYAIWWPAVGFGVTPVAIAQWPDWLAELAMAGRAKRLTDGVPLSKRRPPSGKVVVELLDRMPNPEEVSRDTYKDVMLASQGCIDALIEAAQLSDDDEIEIGLAAVRWAMRWGGKAEGDEAEKWITDWSQRHSPLAGWQTLEHIAEQLIPEYAQERETTLYEVAQALDGGLPPNPGRTEHWQSRLICSKQGPRAVPENVMRALRLAPEWAGVLRFNKFTKAVELHAPPPIKDMPFTSGQELDDDMVTAVTGWLNGHDIFVTSFQMVGKAMRRVALSDSYHPVCDYLNGLAWDGVKRIDTWLADYCGAEDTELNRAIGARFLISGVARVRNPGCKVDTVPVFEGRQGLLKSTMVRILASDAWFVDHMPDLSSKDANLQVQGHWIIEFAELGQFGRADANRAKIFISMTFDEFRAPYDACVKKHLRQCIFAVTMNPRHNGYLKDETGNRRFWPVKLGVGWSMDQVIEVERLKHDRNQLWAEADLRYGQGERWWIHEPELVRLHQELVAERVELSPWFGPVAKAVDELVGQGGITVAEFSYSEVCDKLNLLGLKDRDRTAQMNIGHALTTLGWTGRRAQRNGIRDTFYKFEG